MGSIGMRRKGCPREGPASRNSQRLLPLIDESNPALQLYARLEQSIKSATATMPGVHPVKPSPGLSIVLPVYQNGLNLPDTFQALNAVLDSLPADLVAEFVFVNDGSTDNSLAELMKIQSQSRRSVTVVDLMRNFGQVAALFAGYHTARGQAVVTISADLQDPPELILEMVKHWQQGEKLVLAVRADREDSRFRKWTSWVFYAAMRKFAIATVPIGGFDYFLMDRHLLDMMLSINERNVFLQGQVLWPGTRPFEIPYVRRPRLKGKSQWKLSRKIGYFLDGFTAYTAFPLRLAAWAGAGFCVLACLISAVLVLQRLFYGTEIVGWTSLMIVILLMGGIQMLTVGILGEYLWRTLEQTRTRPMYLVKRIISQDDAKANPKSESKVISQ